MRRIKPPDSLESCFIPNCPTPAATALVADQWLRERQPVLVVLGETLPDAENKCEDIAAIVETISPEITIGFYLFDRTQGPDQPDAFDKMCERLSLLSSLTKINNRKFKDQLLIIATTFEALLGPCPILEKTIQSEVIIRSGSELSYDDFSRDLIKKFDYSSEVVCEEPGQFAIRGGLIDVYPVNADFPVRIDFFGDTVEDLRTFDPTSQRAIESLNEVRISSIEKENTEEREGEFFRYLPNSVLWHFDEPENLLKSYPLIFHETGNIVSEKANLSLIWKRSSDVKDFFITTSEIDAGAGTFENSPRFSLDIQPLIPELESDRWSNPDLLNHEQSLRRSNKILGLIKAYGQSGFKVFISVGADSEKKRIESIMQENELGDLNYSFLPAGLHAGFIYKGGNESLFLSSFTDANENRFIIVTSREILGRERSRRPVRSRKARVQRKEVDQALDFAELVQGDLLVHLQHGICRFEDLGKIEQDGVMMEAITVEFADGILLHVPLQESHLLSRYVGLKKESLNLRSLEERVGLKPRKLPN